MFGITVQRTSSDWLGRSSDNSVEIRVERGNSVNVERISVEQAQELYAELGDYLAELGLL